MQLFSICYKNVFQHIAPVSTQLNLYIEYECNFLAEIDSLGP